MNNIGATGSASFGGSVVYSFFQRWEQPIRARQVQLFFRKRFPSQKPERVYFYIGSPTSAIIGSAAVEKIEKLNKVDALARAAQGCISRDELDRYIGNRETVGAIQLIDFRLFDRPILLNTIHEKIGLLPPQNFQKLSHSECAVIEELASDS